MVRRVSRKSPVLFVVFMLVGIAGLFIGVNKFASFDPKMILDKSILKEKTFNTEVIEIKSPKNEIKAYWYFDDTNPIISISFLFKKSGYAYDFKGKLGLAGLASNLLGEGAGRYSSQGFKEELEAKAISISFSADQDDFSGGLVTIKDNQEKAYELLKVALTAPRFDAQDLRRIKAQTVVAIKRQEEHPSSKLSLEFNKNIFGDHPYSRNPLGEISDIQNISPRDLRNYVKSFLTQDVLVVSIAGDISKEKAEAVLDEVFGSLPKTGKHYDIDDADVDFNGRQVSVKQYAAQTVVMFADKGIERLNEAFYPMYIANHILGSSGLNARLSLKARENEGLTYGIYTYLYNADKADLIKGSFSSTPDNMPRVLEIIKEEWVSMNKNGVTQKELDEAKDYLISSYNLRFASISDISVIMTMMQKENLGIDFLTKRNSYVQNVNLKDVNSAVKDYFKSNNLIFVSIGK